MCTTCGCENTDEVRILLPGEVEKQIHESANEGHGYGHRHSHSHSNDHFSSGDHMHALNHSHDHNHDHNHNHHDHDHHHHHHDHDLKSQPHNSRIIELERDILSKNDLLAERNRGFMEARNILSFNLVSSPGSGKTTILERTVKKLKDQMKFYIIEGDQQTMNDANRIVSAGAPVVQVNTGKGCHLDSEMVHKALKKLDPEAESTVFIENVGNLVCPSLFDLGEEIRIVIMSVTEGEDKPLKYPYMFESSQVCLINKMDLLPYLDYDMDKAIDYVRKINPGIKVIQVSATKDEGMDEWFNWLTAQKTASVADK